MMINYHELQRRALAQAPFAQDGNLTLQMLARMANYRPPVHVPQGWADWYENAEAMP